jgi:hypothetical protein
MNPFNPQNIQAGDKVKLKNPRPDDPKGVLTVSHVGGTHNNKILLEGEWPGHELYAQCFEKQ